MLSRQILLKAFKPSAAFQRRGLATVINSAHQATGASTPKAIKDRATFTIRVRPHR
jgi:hypothetical protein